MNAKEKAKEKHANNHMSRSRSMYEKCDTLKFFQTTNDYRGSHVPDYNDRHLKIRMKCLYQFWLVANFGFSYDYWTAVFSYVFIFTHLTTKKRNAECLLNKTWSKRKKMIPTRNEASWKCFSDFFVWIREQSH